MDGEGEDEGETEVEAVVVVAAAVTLECAWECVHRHRGRKEEEGEEDSVLLTVYHVCTYSHRLRLIAVLLTAIPVAVCLFILHMS